MQNIITKEMLYSAIPVAVIFLLMMLIFSSSQAKQNKKITQVTEHQKSFETKYFTEKIQKLEKEKEVLEIKREKKEPKKKAKADK